MEIGQHCLLLCLTDDTFLHKDQRGPFNHKLFSSIRKRELLEHFFCCSDLVVVVLRTPSNTMGYWKNRKECGVIAAARVMFKSSAALIVILESEHLHQVSDQGMSKNLE